MKDFLSQYKKLVVLAAIGVALVLYFVLRLAPSFRGARDAREDLAHGHYVQLGYGLPTAWASEYDQCLRGYGIEVRNIGSDVFKNGHDVATGFEMSYYQSYNAVSSAAIKEKFGPDVFGQCVDAARKSWDSSHPKAQRD
jgi:hypothetical protein